MAIRPGISQFGSSTGADIEAARANQMYASSLPVDLNAIASPDWQRYFGVIRGRGMDPGGNYKNFDPDLASQQAQQAYAGLLGATGQQFQGFGQSTTPLNALRKVR